MPVGAVHVIGAGLAGLTAALGLAQRGYKVFVHEAAGQAGGRCRSYFDPALGAEIDNGNHLVLSGNRATLAYLASIGAADGLVGPPHAVFDFVDLRAGARWRLVLNDGVAPWWILDAERRVPGTRATDYLKLLRLLCANRTARVGEVLTLNGAVYRRLLEPLLVAALNTDPTISSAALAGAVIRETMLKGGKACRPLVAAQGLSRTFIDPGLKRLGELGAAVAFRRRLRSMRFEAARVMSLEFTDDEIALAANDEVVLAVTAPVAAALTPGLSAPTAFRAIVNAHFALTPPAGLPSVIGVIGGVVEWLFAFEGRLSTTTSNADRLCEIPRAKLAAMIWRDVSQVARLTCAMPRWQIVRERRATFAALPEEDAKRPPAQTRWRNLALAGDWTATGLPATIEGAIRSGNSAAKLVSSRRSRHPEGSMTR